MSSVEDFADDGEVMFDPFAGPDIALSVASTAPQREVWTGAQMGRDASLAFNEASALRFTGELHVSVLTTAVNDVVARHEALRATFSRDGLTMLVGAPEPVSLSVIDLSSLDQPTRAREHESLRQAAVHTEFDLEQGPLARFTLVRLAADVHELIFSAHHIVCDGWSLGVIVGDLATCYTARLRGETPALPDADRFSDYSVAMATEASGPTREAELAYWKAQYASAAPVMDLPTDRPRPARKTYGSAREDLLVPAALLQRVRASGAKAGCSLFATLLTGFTAMVHRLTGEEDLVIGVPSAGQSATGRTGVVGHCVNMLPLRMRVDPTQPVDALLAAVRVQALDAFEHQGLGFGGLLEHISVPRDPSRVPLIGVSFNVDRTLAPSAMHFEGVATAIETIARVSENFDLSVNAIESDAGLQLECQYNTDLFDAGTIRRWLTAYETLLDGVATSTAQPVAALPMLTAEDRAILARCNDTGRTVPDRGLVHALVEATVRETPDAVAVQFADRTLTYAELNRRANRIARHLRAHGVRRGMLVAVLLDRSEDMLSALLGVLKAGAGYVYLDPNYPADRLQFMASDTAAPVLLTDSALAATHGIAAPCIVRVDTAAATIAACDGDDLPTDEHSATPEDTAYVVYTSGSTGKPKGCLLPHRSLINVMVSAMHEPGMTRGDVMLNVTTASFDIGSLELFMPLLLGARVVIAPRSDVVDGERLKALIASSRATLMFGTPAMWRILLENGWEGKRDLSIMCGGEKLALDLARDLAPRVAHVWNIYGPTETTVFSTLWRVPTPVDRVLIGHLAANTHIAILDGRGQQVPVGVQGELFIGGRGVTNGYINRPELTAERFTSIASHPGETFYRTGDLVRLRADAQLEYVGRNDDQVKVRGFRVEPGEIDAVLRTFDGVQQVVVVPREDRANDLRLVAYVITTGGPMDVDGMREHVKQSLPAFMVPNAFVQLEAFPMTPSGKIDRRSLPAPTGASAAASSAAQVLPTTESENVLSALWTQILGLPSVGVTDDFFALGGHSLLASQLLSRLRRDHGVHLTFRNVFENPTIRGLAALMDAADGGGADHAGGVVESIPHRVDATEAPLSVLQERLWLLEELEPTQRAAHAHSASWRLFGALDVDRLDRAIHAFIARHQSMRTSFHTIDGVRRQVVAPTSSFVLARQDLSALTPDAQDATLLEFFREQQFTTFDIATAPLFRSSVIKLGDDHHMLYSLQHGMIWDGWSFDLFLKEVTEFYAAEEQGRAPALDPLTVTYGDFAAWQAGWLAGPEATKQAEWWKQQLSGELQELALPADFPRPAETSGAGNQISLPFTTEEAEQMRALARRYDGTLFMVVFAAYNAVLHHYTGQEDLLVASPVRARTRPELEVVVGPFVNTVMLRTKVHAGMRFPELLRAVRDVTLDSFSNQELPFELLGTRVPAVRALFSMQDARTRPVEMGSLRVEQYHVPQYFTTNDLMLWMMESRTKLYAVLKYSTELFDDATGEAFLTQLRAFLMAVLENPERTIGEIELTTAAERVPLALPAAPVTRTVASQITAAAQADSSRIAVRAERASVTYGDLVERARRIAAGLQAAGAATGATVSVALPAGIDRVTAMLGVLFAGGAVSLLDAEDPDAYRARSVDLAGAAYVITEDGADTGSAVGLEFAALMKAAPLTEAVSVCAQAPALRVSQAGGSGGVVSHAVLSAQLSDLSATLSLTAGAASVATLAAASPTAVLELLLPLTCGATVIVASDDERGEADDLRDLIDDHEPALMFASAPSWRALLATRWKAPAGFRGVIVAGELPDATVVRALAERVTGAFTLLGTAEDGGAASLAAIQPQDGMGYATAHGVGGAVLDVVDSQGRIAPVAVPGVLRVSRGVTGTPGTIRARRMPGDRIQLVNSDPAALWIDGVAVDAALIETALCTHGDVREAAVMVRPDATGAPRVVAWVVARDGATPTELGLRSALRSHLPRACVPQRVVVLAALPRDTAGRVRHDQLESPFSEAAVASAQFVAPRTDREVLLAGLWEAALGVERVGVLDNFFKLGGTSLLCFRIVEQVRKATGQHLNPRALLVGTLQQAAAELSQAPQTAPSVTVTAQPAGVMSRLKGLIT